jgi:hypothetical protein
VPTALRQLRMRVLDAHGPGLAKFAERARGIALLAQRQAEPEAAAAIASLAQAAVTARGDVRNELYEGLDRVHAKLGAMQ